MIEGAFTYPTDSDSWLTTIIIGGVLTFLGFLIVPLFVVYGYVVHAIRDTVEGGDEPPAFGDWGDLIVDGLQAWIVGIVYLLVPTIVAIVTVGGSIAAILTGNSAGEAAGVAGLFGGFALTAVLSLVFGYFAAAAIVNFACEGSLGAAFDFGTVRQIAFDGDYAVAWLVSVVVFIVAGIVTGIPLIGWVIAPFLTFYASVVAARLWGGGYLDAVGGGTAAPADAG